MDANTATQKAPNGKLPGARILSTLEFKLSSIEKHLARGFLGVIPLYPNSKLPRLLEWQKNPFRTLAEAEKHWLKYPNDGVGVLLGGGIACIDLDKKGGRNGFESLAELEILEDPLPEGLTVTTASGGAHRYFRYDAGSPLKSNKDTLFGPGVELLADGGRFAVAPPTVINGRAYTDNDEPIPPLPSWVIRRAGMAPPKSQAPYVMPEGFDVEREIAWAREYLVSDSCSIAVEGDGGDNATLQVALKLVRDHGIPPRIAASLMDELWNPRCVPPWTSEELATKCENAARYGRNEVGSGTAQRAFESVTDDPTPNETKGPAASKFNLKLFSKITVRRAVAALIKGLLGLCGLLIIYGDSGIGKSFWAFYLALHVALGEEFYGLKVAQGAVIYVCLENGVGFENRIAAAKKSRGLDGVEVPFGLVTCPINLMDGKGDTQLLISEIEKAAVPFGMPVSLLVIDTLARAMSGGDENSVQDMSTFVGHLDLIREKTKAAIIVIHHSGKDKAKGARGSSALRAAADSELEVSEFEFKRGKATHKVPGVRVVRVTKQRDFEGGQEFGFRLRAVELGQDDDGDVIRSCVVEPENLAAHRNFVSDEPEATSGAGKALALLRVLLEQEPAATPDHLKLLAGERVVKLDLLRERFYSEHCGDVENKATKWSRFKRAMDEIRSASMCVMEKDGYVWI